MTTLGEGDLTGDVDVDLEYGDDGPGLLGLTMTPPPEWCVRALLKSGREMLGWRRGAGARLVAGL